MFTCIVRWATEVKWTNGLLCKQWRDGDDPQFSFSAISSRTYIIQCWIELDWKQGKKTSYWHEWQKFFYYHKSVNLQNIVRWVAGTNDSSTKRLMKSVNLRLIHAGSLGRLDKWIVDQASDVPSIIFFRLFIDLGHSKTLYFDFCIFSKK